ncbi:MAG: D-alanine--D-alanine ligase, partial [Calditrichales bacterium]
METMKKKRIGILFGGQSAEHEVSLQSAKSVIEAINKDKYELVLMGIERDGTWYLIDMAHFLRNADDPKSISLEHGNKRLALVPGSTGPHFILADSGKAIASPDVMFPVLHGPFGEDGTVQGFLQLADLPFVGAGVRGSAIGMDKEIMKRLLEQAGIAQANFRSYHYRDKASISYDKMNSELGMPCFVKPANLGSSVGITKAHDQNAFDQAVEKAFRYDEKIVIEEYIRGREIECSVLGNETPVASLPGEIKPSHEYYSYQAKYLDSNGAQFAIPAA